MIYQTFSSYDTLLFKCFEGSKFAGIFSVVTIIYHIDPYYYGNIISLIGKARRVHIL